MLEIILPSLQWKELVKVNWAMKLGDFMNTLHSISLQLWVFTKHLFPAFVL